MIDYVPGKDCLACEQLVLLLYPTGGPRPTSTFRNLEWWDSINVEDANRTSCPTFPNIPAEHESEVTRLRMEVMRGLIAASEGSPEAERLWKLLTYLDRILFCPNRVGARPDEVVRNIDVPNRNQNTSRGGLQRLPSGFVSSRPGSGLSFGEKLCGFPMRRGTRLRQVCGSRLRNAAPAAQTHSGKKVSLLGLVPRHSRHLIQCAPMTCCSSSGTSSLLARSVTTCPARIRRSAGPMTYAHASWRRSRRSSAPYRVAPARDQRARGLSTG